jgi:hypothetical protein
MSLTSPHGGTLTPELLDLMEHEKVIEQGLAGFMEVGNALLSIRDGRKYLAAGYGTFEDYCRKRWSISRSYAHRTMEAAQAAGMLPIGNIGPRSESQVRPLTRLDDPEQRAEAWSEAVENAGGQPTAKQVDEAVRRHLDRHQPFPMAGPTTQPAADDPDLAHWLGKGRRPPGVEDLPSEDDGEDPQSEWQPTKPDLGGGISHPARYSPELVDLFRTILAEYGIPGDNILDPFAGTGRVHELQTDGWDTVGIELEPEWADLHPDTRVGDATDLPFDPESFGAIITSPTYGNRLADSHNATDPERRRSYTHDLGRDLGDTNTGTLHWRTSPPGREAAGSLDYRTMHEKAWGEAVLVLAPGGLFILNCCDHVRDGLVQPVTAWHCWALGRLGLDYVESRSVPTRKLRQGANGDLREQEQVHVFRKPT